MTTDAAARHDDAQGRQGRRNVLYGAGFALLTALAVFVLPFSFPPTVPAVSPSYMAGFNNRVAEIAAALLSLAVLLVALRRVSASRETAAEPLSRRWLLWATALLSAMLLVLGTAMVRANIFYGEAEYFLTQMEKGIKLHLVLYRQLQFAYGPLLYWVPVGCIRALRPLGVPDQAGYVGSLLLIQAAGLWLLWYAVRALPLRRGLQGFCFAVLVAGALPPTMGPNYIILRFALPLAVATLLARQRGLARAFVVAALGTLAGFLVSAEIGVGCVGAVMALAAYRAWLHGWRWLGLVAAGLAGLGLFALGDGGAAFEMVVNAGTGGYDLLLTPEPRTLYVLIAVVGLAPLAVARAVRSGSPAAGTLVALYGSALGTLPVALGRADSIHEFSFSFAAMVLSVVAVAGEGTRRLPARLWLLALVGWVTLVQTSNYRLYRVAFADLLRQGLHPEPDRFDMARLERDLGGHRVFIVDALSWTTTNALLDRGLLQPAFQTTFSGVWQARGEQRKIADMRAGDFAITPAGGLIERPVFLDGPLQRWTRLGLPYRQKHPPFTPGAMTVDELKRNWVLVDTVSENDLYRRVH